MSTRLTTQMQTHAQHRQAQLDRALHNFNLRKARARGQVLQLHEAQFALIATGYSYVDIVDATMRLVRTIKLRAPP
jgi:hypothetical protein